MNDMCDSSHRKKKVFELPWKRGIISLRALRFRSKGSNLDLVGKNEASRELELDSDFHSISHSPVYSADFWKTIGAWHSLEM